MQGGGAATGGNGSSGGMGLIGPIAGGLMGMWSDGINARRQRRNQRELNQQGLENSMALGEWNRKLEMQMWNDTNYSAQIEQMKKAGLNPGLMYQQGGSGGTTQIASGSQSGGQATGGTNTATQGMAVMLQAQMMQSQIEFNKANAQKATAEADSTRGAEGTTGASQIGKNTQDVAFSKVMQENVELQNIVKNATLDTEIDTAGAKYNQIITDIRATGLQNKVNEEVINEKIQQVRLQTIKSSLENELIGTQIGVNKANIDKIANEIEIRWEQLSINLKNAGTAQRAQVIQKFTAEMNATLGFKNLEQRRIEMAVNGVSRIID